MKLSNSQAIVLAVLIAAAVAWFFAATDSGQALLGTAPSRNSNVPTENTNRAPDGAPVTTKIYRWRDARGNLNVSTEPPPPGVKFDVREYRDDQNVVPSGGGVIGQ
jgi:hypothetical protein